MNAYSEPELVRALKRLEKRWPEGYVLFSWAGTLCLINLSDLPSPSRVSGHPKYRSSYEDAVVETFPGISSDGGDPD